MKYTEKQRREIARAFKLARGFLQKHGSNNVPYICVILGDYQAAGKISWHTFNNARSIILTRLGGYHSYGSWLNETHPKVYEKHYAEAQVKGRIAWLDSLINEFSK